MNCQIVSNFCYKLWWPVKAISRFTFSRFHLLYSIGRKREVEDAKSKMRNRFRVSRFRLRNFAFSPYIICKAKTLKR